MISYKYKVRFHLHEKKIYTKLNLLHTWLKFNDYFLFYFVKKLKKKLVTILKSPHVNKKAREQFKSFENRFFYFFRNRKTINKFFRFFMFFALFFEYMTRFVWYTKQGLVYIK